MENDQKRLKKEIFPLSQISELLKLGSESYEDLKQFSVCIEEKLFRMDVHRDRALTYKTEEIQLTAVDEVYVEQDKTGHVIKQLCRVRVFFLSFLTGEMEQKYEHLHRLNSPHYFDRICVLENIHHLTLYSIKGMPEIELGVNDITRMGLEVVGRHDILPVTTEQWIRYEDIEFHTLVDKKEFEKNDHIIK